MRDKHYRVKQFRISEETYEKLKELKEKENISWNILITKLLEQYESNNTDTR